MAKAIQTQYMEFRVGEMIFIKDIVKSINLRTGAPQEEEQHWIQVKAKTYSIEGKVIDTILNPNVHKLDTYPYKFSIFGSNDKESTVVKELHNICESITGAEYSDLEVNAREIKPENWILLTDQSVKVIVDGKLEIIEVDPYIIKLEKSQTVHTRMSMAGMLSTNLVKSAENLRLRNIANGSWMPAQMVNETVLENI